MKRRGFLGGLMAAAIVPFVPKPAYEDAVDAWYATVPKATTLTAYTGQVSTFEQNAVMPLLHVARETVIINGQADVPLRPGYRRMTMR